MSTDWRHCDGSLQALGVIAPSQEEAVATDDSTGSTADGRIPGKVTASERVVEAESCRQRDKPAITKLVDRTGSDRRRGREKVRPGHSSAIPWRLLEDFTQPVELDLVLKTRAIHLAVSLAAIC
jgi:hypothetical protein